MQLNIIKQEYLLAGQFKCRRLYTYSHVALLLHEYVLAVCLYLKFLTMAIYVSF